LPSKKRQRKETKPASLAPQETPAPPSIHEAELSVEFTGAVDYGAEISEAQAIARRKVGLDIVVRGTDRAANRRVAGRIEMAVGNAIPHFPHRTAGAYALPHWQQESHTLAGHSFYETDNLKARKKKP
jgi:hypothetical protein